MSDAGFSTQERVAREMAIKAAFSPYSPIDDVKFFRGRLTQIRAALDSISSTGLHALIFGERGVGKTSLANILSGLLEGIRGSARVTCSQSDSFSGITRRALGALRFAIERPRPGFEAGSETEFKTLADSLPQNGRVSPDAVAALLSILPGYVVLVFDEFDRLASGVKAAFADMIKSLSDRGGDATIVLVGVAEDVNELVENHASIQRCVRQIPMPRMDDTEISEIITGGLSEAGFTYLPGVPKSVVSVAQGFPHYAHLLGQNAARSALDDSRLDVREGDVIRGLDAAVQDTDQTHRDLFYKAITGTKKTNLWREVVTACALARSDERGFFATRDVQESLSRILGRPVIQQTVAFHLGKLIEETRGPLLERRGPERRYRYRFINPLMRPFVLMKGMADGLVQTS